MSGVYKEKVCPVCNKRHRKRNAFCSRSCGNQKRHTAETKQKISKKIKEIMKSPEAIAHKRLLSLRNAAIHAGREPPSEFSDDFYINIPDIRESPSIEDGDIWEATDW